MIVGVISDTHGLLRDEAIEALRGVDLILHAGDVGDPHVLISLERLARVAAVRGNVDTGTWARNLPEERTLTVEEVRIYIIHDLGAIDPALDRHEFDLIISGHSHEPKYERRDGVRYLNPGSAGPRRFKLPTTVARLTITGKDVGVDLVHLKRGE